MPTARRTTQHTVGVEDELWNDCLLIARARHTKLSQVVRDLLVDYREEHADLLDRLKAEQAPRDP
jgi:rhamnogalacturonyl hydrolase YesR